MTRKSFKVYAYLLIGIITMFIGMNVVNAESLPVQFCSDEGEWFAVSGPGISDSSFRNQNNTDNDFANAIKNNFKANGKTEGTVNYNGNNYTYYYHGMDNAGYGYVTRCIKFYNEVNTSTEGVYNGYAMDCVKPETLGAVNNDESFWDKKNRVYNIVIDISEPFKSRMGMYQFQIKVGGNLVHATVDNTNGKIRFTTSAPEYSTANKKARLIEVAAYFDPNIPTAVNFYTSYINSKGFSTSSTVGGKSYKEYCSNGNGVVLAGFFKDDEFIKSTATLTVTNEYKNRANSICKEVYAYEKASDAEKKNWVEDCYKDEYRYSDYANIESNVRRQFDLLKKFYDNTYESEGLATVENLTCTYAGLGLKQEQDEKKDDLAIPFEKKTTYSYSGEYWGIRCDEEYYIKPSDPQFVNAGQGVSYPNKLEIRRTCGIYNKKLATQPPVCSCSSTVPYCDTAISYGGSYGTAGPTEDMDNCVNVCDNGQYTQKCINKCYKEVYGKERKLSDKISGSFLTRKSIVKEEKNAGAEAGDNSFNVTEMIKNNNKNAFSENVNGYTVSYDPNKACNGKPHCLEVDGQQIGVSDWCINNAGALGGTNCSFSVSCGPAGCMDGAAADAQYANELKKSAEEYRKLTRIAQVINEVGSYKIGFIDSETKVKYVIENETTLNNGQPHLLIKNNENYKIKCASTYDNAANNGFRIGDTEYNKDGISNRIYDYCDIYTGNLIYDVDLPTAYSLTSDPETIIVSNENRDGQAINYFSYNKTTRGNDGDLKYVFKSYPGFSPILAAEGQRVFYTQLHARDTNVNTYVDCLKDKCEDKTTQFGCDASLKELIATASYHNEKEMFGEVERTIYDKNGKVVADLGFKTLFDGKAFNYYEIGDYAYAKILTDSDKNIEVNFKIKTVGESTSEANMTGATITEFKDTGYKCFYGVTNMIMDPYSNRTVDDDVKEEYVQKTSCDKEDDETEYRECTACHRGTQYYYHEIDLEDIFADSATAKRVPRWNWSAAAIDRKNSEYIIDPPALIEDIELKGEKVWDDPSEVDYEFTITRKLIQEIRNYNKTKVNGKKIPYTTFMLKGDKNKNYSELIEEWYKDTQLPSQALSITEYNNVKSNRRYDY